MKIFFDQNGLYDIFNMEFFYVSTRFQHFSSVWASNQLPSLGCGSDQRPEVARPEQPRVNPHPKWIRHADHEGFTGQTAEFIGKMVLLYMWNGQVSTIVTKVIVGLD